MMHAPDPDDAVARSGLRIVLGLMPGLGNSFWNVVINAIEDVLIRAGYGVIFGDTRGDPVREAHYERLLRSGHVDGLILFNARPSWAPRLFEIGLPTTVVFNDMPDLDRVPVFGVDNREAAATMVEYLLSLGHRRIAHITGPEENLDAQARLRGYGDALARRRHRSSIPALSGAAATPSLPAPRRRSATWRSPTTARRQSSPRATRVAIGCISALREAGVDRPRRGLGRRLRRHRLLRHVRAAAHHDAAAARRARPSCRRGSRPPARGRAGAAGRYAPFLQARHPSECRASRPRRQRPAAADGRRRCAAGQDHRASIASKGLRPATACASGG